jgi:hypothetical protein
LYTLTLGKNSGNYILTEAKGNNQITLKELENFDEKVKLINFKTKFPGKELTLGVSGVIEEKRFEQKWKVCVRN